MIFRFELLTGFFLFFYFLFWRTKSRSFTLVTWKSGWRAILLSQVTTIFDRFRTEWRVDSFTLRTGVVFFEEPKRLGCVFVLFLLFNQHQTRNESTDVHGGSDRRHRAPDSNWNATSFGPSGESPFLFFSLRFFSISFFSFSPPPPPSSSFLLLPSSPPRDAAPALKRALATDWNFWFFSLRREIWLFFSSRTPVRPAATRQVKKKRFASRKEPQNSVKTRFFFAQILCDWLGSNKCCNIR